MAKLFLQKDQLESLQNKLDRAVQLLKWAQGCYVQAQLSRLMWEDSIPSSCNANAKSMIKELSRSQHHVVLSAITTIQPWLESSTELSRTEGAPDGRDEDGSGASASRSPVLPIPKSNRSKRIIERPAKLGTFKIQNEDCGYTLVIQPLTWICPIFWELHAQWACAISTYHFRQYRYRSRDDRFLGYVEDGDIKNFAKCLIKAKRHPLIRQYLRGIHFYM